jgi:hypothetical protein
MTAFKFVERLVTAITLSHFNFFFFFFVSEGYICTCRDFLLYYSALFSGRSIS